MVLIWGKQHFANLGTTDQRQASSVMFQLRISAGLIPARKLNHTERPDVMESLDQLHLITRRCVGEAFGCCKQLVTETVYQITNQLTSYESLTQQRISSLLHSHT
jgi:hypothetical protein